LFVVVFALHKLVEVIAVFGRHQQLYAAGLLPHTVGQKNVTKKRMFNAHYLSDDLDVHQQVTHVLIRVAER
jgi:hypothetical protein